MYDFVVQILWWSCSIPYTNKEVLLHFLKQIVERTTANFNKLIPETQLKLFSAIRYIQAVSKLHVIILTGDFGS